MDSRKSPEVNLGFLYTEDDLHIMSSYSKLETVNRTKLDGRDYLLNQFSYLFSPWSMLELNALNEAHDLSNSMLTPLPTKITSSTWYSYEYSSMLVEIWQPL